MTKNSPLAPEKFPKMPPVDGIRLAVAASGIRYQGCTDLLLVEMAHGSAVAGVFTNSLTAAAPVEICRKHLVGGRASSLVVNSGNANAFTGKAGRDAVQQTAEAVADLFACRPSSVFVSSTGVIGEILPVDRIIQALPEMAKNMDGNVWESAARAIMTTDTFPKGATRQAEIGGVLTTLNGIAKGSGMIAPNMATTLAYVFTDAAIPANVLQALLKSAADRSFNCITVDGDTSTNDALMLFATGAGAAHPKAADADDPLLDDFKAKLESLLIDLAQQVVRDGEGASKFATITVNGAADDGAAKRIALTIANSPLVKTAIAGEDANWGRIVMAVGKAGEKIEQDRLTIAIGGVVIAKGGALPSGYDETLVTEHMKGQNVDIDVGVGVGDGRATVWTCDLTHGYIDINADYRS